MVDVNECMINLEDQLREYGWLSEPDNAVIVPIPAREKRTDEVARVQYVIFKELKRINCWVNDLDGRIREIAAKENIKLPEGSFTDPPMFYFQYFIKDQPEHPIYIIEAPEESKSLLGPELTIAMHLPKAQPNDWQNEYHTRLNVVRDFMRKYYQSYSKKPACEEKK